MKKLFAIVLFLSSFHFAQTQTLTVGKIELELGKDRDSVLDIIDNSYYVEEDPSIDNLFTIWDTDKKRYPYGEIKFDNSNKLIEINKLWSSTVNDSHSQIFEQIIKLIETYTKNGEIVVDANEIFEPNYSTKTLSFTQGKKIIQITLIGNRITLQEFLKDSN